MCLWSVYMGVPQTALARLGRGASTRLSSLPIWGGSRPWKALASGWDWKFTGRAGDPDRVPGWEKPLRLAPLAPAMPALGSGGGKGPY